MIVRSRCCTAFVASLQRNSATNMGDNVGISQHENPQFAAAGMAGASMCVRREDLLLMIPGNHALCVSRSFPHTWMPSRTFGGSSVRLNLFPEVFCRVFEYFLPGAFHPLTDHLPPKRFRCSKLHRCSLAVVSFDSCSQCQDSGFFLCSSFAGQRKGREARRGILRKQR